ncbi:hypothetical protein [Streptomyces sp. NBC_01262]|uniref:hypothetical protein n=1 Tax=Streptomyces sp. NBC_01262 TaxID=2903803 RepID=UPI002E301E8A|nr:hypothetical protein [Streptomyces sp. NBC_01262]
MIGVVGHADLTAETLELLESQLRQRLSDVGNSGRMGLARVGSGVPVAFARAAYKAGLSMVAVLPSQNGVPAPLSEQDAIAAGAIVVLAQHVRLLDFDPGDRGGCVTADENLIVSCRLILAVWDGSWSTPEDATAHLVAYARSRGVSVEVLWPAGASRISLLPCPAADAASGPEPGA